MSLNFSKLFNQDSKPSFLKNISPITEEEIALKQAKNEIQQHLKISIPKWLEMRLGEKPDVVPRFRSQGSWAYKTCNGPCWHPPQEMDYDLGIYLPVSIWNDNDIHPTVAAKVYYDMIHGLITPLAEIKNWNLINKHTCVRVNLNNGTRAHVDLPLYVAPNEEFKKIVESRMAMESAFMNRFAFADVSAWDSLSRISLACRDGSWSPSDPGKVVVWFKKKMDRHGQQLNRICRYLKAWRDHTWESGGPSSILLMVCATQTLDRTQADFESRDDLALAHVTEALSRQLGTQVKEIMIDPDEDLNRLSDIDRQRSVQEAINFHNSVRDALGADASNREEAIRLIQRHLGQRFPNDLDGIDIDVGPTNIRVIPAEQRPRATIIPTKAG